MGPQSGMTSVLMKKGNLDTDKGRIPCKDEGRGEADASRRNVSNCQQTTNNS